MASCRFSVAVGQVRCGEHTGVERGSPGDLDITQQASEVVQHHGAEGRNADDKPVDPAVLTPTLGDCCEHGAPPSMLFLCRECDKRCQA